MKKKENGEITSSEITIYNYVKQITNSLLLSKSEERRIQWLVKQLVSKDLKSTGVRGLTLKKLTIYSAYIVFQREKSLEKIESLQKVFELPKRKFLHLVSGLNEHFRAFPEISDLQKAYLSYSELRKERFLSEIFPRVKKWVLGREK